MSREETIQLLDLLGQYVVECESKQKEYRDIETKQELAVQIMITNHTKYANEIIEVLCFDL